MGVPKGPLPRPLVFLLRKNNLPGRLSPDFALFTEDMSLVSVSLNVYTPSNELNDDLSKIYNPIFLWKIYFNQDFQKQAQKAIFL